MPSLAYCSRPSCLASPASWRWPSASSLGKKSTREKRCILSSGLLGARGLHVLGSGSFASNGERRAARMRSRRDHAARAMRLPLCMAFVAGVCLKLSGTFAAS